MLLLFLISNLTIIIITYSSHWTWTRWPIIVTVLGFKVLTFGSITDGLEQITGLERILFVCIEIKYVFLLLFAHLKPITDTLYHTPGTEKTFARTEVGPPPI